MSHPVPAGLDERVRSIHLNYGLDQDLDGDTPAIEQWWVSAHYRDWSNLDDDGDANEETVALFHIVKGSMLDAGLWDQLDALEVDLEMVASALLNRDDGQLTEEAQDQLIAGTGTAILILNSATVSTAWRGYGIGVLLAGIALQTLEGDVACIATYPAPLDGSSGPERERAVAKLAQVWQQLSFEHLDGGVWILDPAGAAFGDAITRMKWRFGLT